MSKERLQSQCNSLDNFPLMSIGFGSEYETGEAVLAAGDRLLAWYLLTAVVRTQAVNLPYCRPWDSSTQTLSCSV